MNKRHIHTVFLLLLVSVIRTASAQVPLTMKGTIRNASTNLPVKGASVIAPETVREIESDVNGTFAVTFPARGAYTLVIQAPGMEELRTKIIIRRDFSKVFLLYPRTERGRELLISAKKEQQKNSRRTISRKEMKDVPATLGDSINAVTSLPGISRTVNELFGPLVVRGGNYLGTKFFVDDIPMYHPLHYGGLHSVINSNIMDRIDCYSSSFPARFGDASSAVISITTVDSADDFGGFIDISAISSSVLFSTPILRGKDGDVSTGLPMTDAADESDKAGYIIASARRGYLDLIALPLAEAITGNEANVAPVYWDYQFKAKYVFNRSHSIALLSFGSGDYMRYYDRGSEDLLFDVGDDPLLENLSLTVDKECHIQGLFHEYRRGGGLRNRIVVSSTLMRSNQYLNLPAQGVNEAFKDYHVDSRPHIFSFRERLSLSPIPDFLDLMLGADYTYYHFTASGKTIVNRTGGMFGTYDISDPLAHAPLHIDEYIPNHVAGLFAEASITWGRLRIDPGYRSDYLVHSGEVTWDPRISAELRLFGGTSLTIAGGKYSYFFQVNPYLFDQSPQVSGARGGGLTSEKAIHRSAGIEHEFGLFTVTLEGFYNDFSDLFQPYYHYGPDGCPRQGMSSGRIRTWGFEFMIKKELDEHENGLFGWINYSFTKSRFRSGLPVSAGLYGNTENLQGDPYGDTWISYPYEQEHSLKIIAGYVYFRHTVSLRFQLSSSYPYTPIAGSGWDADYYSNYGMDRYYPVAGRPYSRHFPAGHRLDLRYSYRRVYSWGYISWYIEIINVYNFIPDRDESWDYSSPYGPNNPTRDRDRTSFGIIPNAGIELKF